MEENKTSSNMFVLIEKAGEKIKGNVLNAIVGTLCFLTPFFLSVLIPVVLFAKLDQEWLYMLLIAIAVAIWGPMELGYIKYFKRLTAGEDPSPLSVFKGFATKNFFIYFVAGVVLFLIYSIGFALAIFPLYIMLAFYGMTFFYLENEQDDSRDLFSAMKRCSKDMTRSRIMMLSYKFLFHIIYLLLFAIALLAGKLLLNWAEIAPIWASVVASISVIVYVLTFTLITVYYHACNQCMFDEIPDRVAERNTINEKELIARSNKGKAAPIAVPAPQAEEKVESVKTETKPAKTTATKPAAKPAAKKEVAKETTIKPPQKPAAKTSTKKTEETVKPVKKAEPKATAVAKPAAKKETAKAATEIQPPKRPATKKTTK